MSLILGFVLEYKVNSSPILVLLFHTLDHFELILSILILLIHFWSKRHKTRFKYWTDFINCSLFGPLWTDLINYGHFGLCLKGGRARLFTALPAQKAGPVMVRIRVSIRVRISVRMSLRVWLEITNANNLMTLIT